ncbi:Flp pilus assembly protein TadG [Phocoenobacter uteri]|uniref:Flp pilus assembly protein TadG n=1 Tax=Phocoenobacter uteri TaxID=146806 RepID=A0A379CAU5_9PAST|nr:pilus assembly protein [Phocoenobacter uteri]MDG6882632.1 hypothetical protein [Phocoenobacter uteri]SUB58797.1 Flp pilus assembly protein TadG [Phocoenobacter uteri]
MNSIKRIYKNCGRISLQFLKDEQGVYTIMMTLMSFGLLGFMALVVDGSGILLDKARFTQGMEQAGLLLVAENNKDRRTHEHANVNRQKVTDEYIKEKFNNNRLKAKQDKRNKEMIAAVVRSYYQGATYKPDDHTVTDQYTYHCSRLKRSQSVACAVDGNFDRPSWLYLGENFGLTFAKTVKISADTIYVTKRRDATPPIDLMLITDLSTSMTKVVDGNGSRDNKITILRRVFGKVSDKLLKDRKDNYNRIGFTSFALGSQQKDDTTQCVLPYKWNSEANRTHQLTKRVTRYEYDGYWRRYYWNGPYDYKYQNSYLDDIKDMFSYSEWSSNRQGYHRFNDGRATYRETKGDIFYRMRDLLNKSVDYPATVGMIDQFDGKDLKNIVTFDKNVLCLLDEPSNNATQQWFKNSENSKLNQAFSRVNPQGGTLSSSGLLVGANLMMNKNEDPKASPDNLSVNTQRTIIILSDGLDGINVNLPFDITKNLIRNGMCNKIRKRIDTLQDKDYQLQKTKIGFVAFGYDKDQRNSPHAATQAQAWKECVGDGNFFVANNEEELLKAFDQLSKPPEEVGRSTNKNPFKK